MNFEQLYHNVRQYVLQGTGDLKSSISLEAVAIQPPNKAGKGDLCLPCFAFSKIFKKKPADVAAQVAGNLQPNELVEKVQPDGPYLNLVLTSKGLALAALGEYMLPSEVVNKDYHTVIEFSSPNTNKPQHLGHVRNNILGAAVSNILKHSGQKVSKICLINDRGIHICKSMLAYKLFGKGETPESSGIKGDHLVGNYYVVCFFTSYSEYPIFFLSLSPSLSLFFNSLWYYL